jgi:methylase of polypeptide subunit release factors
MPFGSLKDEPFDRDCSARYEAIQRSTVIGGSWLDLGCAEGFFSVSLARDGASKVTGIDHNQTALMLAQRAALEMCLPQVSFVQGRIIPELIDSTKACNGIERWDHLLFLSTAHLIAYYDGIPAMMDILHHLPHVASEMFFDMGHSKEKAKWTVIDMGEDVDLYIREMLLKTGWKSVIKIGEFSGPKDHVSMRSLFQCTR